MGFSDKLQRAWELAGCKNQREAAKRLGWAPQRLNNYMTATRWPPRESLLHIATTFSVPISFLVDDGSDPEDLQRMIARFLELEGIAPVIANSLSSAGAELWWLRSLPVPDGVKAQRRPIEKDVADIWLRIKSAQHST